MREVWCSTLAADTLDGLGSHSSLPLNRHTGVDMIVQVTMALHQVIAYGSENINKQLHSR